MMDVIADIGGVGALIEGLVEVGGFIFIINFIWSLSVLIKRKQQHKIRKKAVQAQIDLLPKI